MGHDPLGRVGQGTSLCIAAVVDIDPDVGVLRGEHETKAIKAMDRGKDGGKGCPCARVGDAGPAARHLVRRLGKLMPLCARDEFVAGPLR